MVRTLPTSASADISGADYMDAVSESVADIYDRLAIKLSSIGGTANAITATCTPAFDAGLVSGMAFFLTPTSDNTGAVTIAINSESAVPVVNSDGSALTAGILVSGWTYMGLFNGTSLVLIGSSTLTKINDYQQFTSSGTWTKPANCPANARVLVELWGGGGAGGYNATGFRSGGGGGGAYRFKWFLAGDLASTETVTVGAGGVIGSDGAAGGSGGTSSFGSHITAPGGGGGFGNSGGGAGGGSGAGTTAAGQPGTSSAGGAEVGLGYGHQGSPGGFDAHTTSSVEGGSGGGGTDGSSAFNAGHTFNGGAGGGSVGNPATIVGAAGTSTNGGNGGAKGVAGSAPGGGGGALANGARGEVIVWVTG